ncbi:MAG: 4-hydroxy-tetrahydrodipicolinate reductase [Chthoniobacterales bacterium]
MSVTRVLLVGAKGRMGQIVQSVAVSSADTRVTETVEIGEPIADRISNCDVVIDFSQADAIESVLAACVSHGKPLVVGTTGHSTAQSEALDAAAEKVPVLVAPNFSVGVNVLFWLTRKTAELLGRDFDLEIVEAHHRLKKDSPSGTAKRLGQILCEVRALNYDEYVAHGREGILGERGDNEIGMHAIRGGDIVGDHTVIFAGRGERLELTHKASSRETFAAGALRAARWIVAKPPGRYSMEDVLSLQR